MPAGGAERARELAACGADCVLLGDAAMHDSALLASLSAELGEGKVGVWVPARRMSVGWALDFECNADFRCLAPSRVTPAWEILSSTGQGTGTDAGWWIAQMLERGAAMAVVAVDIDDAGLNICAGLTEQFASRLWFTPLHDLEADLRPWVEYGHATNLVLPAIGRYDEAAAARTTRAFFLPPEDRCMRLRFGAFILVSCLFPGFAWAGQAALFDGAQLGETMKAGGFCCVVDAREEGRRKQRPIPFSVTYQDGLKLAARRLRRGGRGR